MAMGDGHRCIQVGKGKQKEISFFKTTILGYKE
jgi:hypothetical protein